MTLQDMTLTQLERLYRRLYARIGSGDPFGADWRTLKLSNPGLHGALEDTLAAIQLEGFRYYSKWIDER